MICYIIQDGTNYSWMRQHYLLRFHISLNVQYQWSTFYSKDLYPFQINLASWVLQKVVNCFSKLIHRLWIHFHLSYSISFLVSLNSLWFKHYPLGLICEFAICLISFVFNRWAPPSSGIHWSSFLPPFQWISYAPQIQQCPCYSMSGILILSSWLPPVTDLLWLSPSWPPSHTFFSLFWFPYCNLLNDVFLPLRYQFLVSFYRFPFNLLIFLLGSNLVPLSFFSSLLRALISYWNSNLLICLKVILLIWIEYLSTACLSNPVDSSASSSPSLSLASNQSASMTNLTWME